MLGVGNYLWRLVPANPILLRVVEAGGKRKRDLLIRCIYLGGLLGVVIFLLLQSAGSLASADLAELSKQSASIFYGMSYLQLFLVTLLAPVFTAGAITQEKDSQTYDILLSTPLTNGQIVLGSLLSRLFFVLALLISGIPIFSVTQIFGGVAIRDITMSFLIAAATAFVTGALAMAIATFKVGTRRTIFSFYLFIMLYLAIPLALEYMGYFRVPGRTQNSHISLFSGFHPFLALKCIFGLPEYMPPDPGTLTGYSALSRWYLSSPHTFYVSFMMFLSIVLVTPSIILLRMMAQTNLTFRGWLLTKLHLSKGDKTRKPRYVWSNPIAWREAKTKASASRAVFLRYGFMVLGIAGAVTILYFSHKYPPVRTYIATAGYDPVQGTVTINDDNVPEVYRIRTQPETVAGRISQPTAIFLVGVTETGQPQKVGTEYLRDGMIVEPGTLIPDANAKGRVLNSITLRFPQPVLSELKARQFLLGAIMVELAVILLVVTQSAASTVTREKEDGTLDLLLSTPITSRYYIWGKLRGLVSFVLPLIAVPLFSILLFVVADIVAPRRATSTGTGWMVFPESVLVLPGTLIMSAAFAAILGMQMSLRCRKTVMAVMSSVAIVAGIGGGLWMCGYSAASSAGFGQPGLAIAAFSPFTLIAMLVSPLDVAPEVFTSTVPRDLIDARVLIFIFGWIATAIYALVVWGMYKSMVHNFDMTIRKQSS